MKRKVKISDIARARIDSADRSCFVIMAINENYALQSYFEEAIVPTVVAVGLKPIRIDKEVFVNKITDEIANKIQEAEVIIVDTTEDRPNCYFEAGYAVALEKNLIWLRSASLASENIPFDVKDYRFILYKTVGHLRLELEKTLRGILMV